MKYNQSLDHVALGIAALRAGHSVEATKQFSLAAYAKDAPDAVRIIELSNTDALAKAKVSAKVKASAKPKLKTNAAARIKASEEDMADDDMAEDDVDTEVNDADDDSVAGEDFDADSAEVDDTEDFSEQFASIMASMHKKAKAKAK